MTFHSTIQDCIGLIMIMEFSSCNHRILNMLFQWNAPQEIQSPSNYQSGSSRLVKQSRLISAWIRGFSCWTERNNGSQIDSLVLKQLMLHLRKVFNKSIWILWLQPALNLALGWMKTCSSIPQLYIFLHVSLWHLCIKSFILTQGSVLSCKMPGLSFLWRRISPRSLERSTAKIFHLSIPSWSVNNGYNFFWRCVSRARRNIIDTAEILFSVVLQWTHGNIVINSQFCVWLRKN